jgi:hypothetical protein
MGGRGSGSGFRAGGSNPTVTAAASAPQQVTLNGRTYRVNGIIHGEDNDFADAEYQYNGQWHKVRNAQMQIDIARALASGSASTPSAAAAYLTRIGDNPSRVKYERVKSLSRGDGVFLTDDELNQNISYATGRSTGDIQRSRFVSIPDNSGYADVEVTFQNPTSRSFTGGIDMGSGRRTFRTTGGGTTVQRIRIKILNP